MEFMHLVVDNNHADKAAQKTYFESIMTMSYE